MAFRQYSRVRETSATTGTGTYTLAGAVPRYRRFGDVLSNGDTCLYLAKLGTDWEIGRGTWSTGHTLARTSVLKSTNGNAAVSWPAGDKDIAMVAVGISDMDATALADYLTLLGLGTGNSPQFGGLVLATAAAGYVVTATTSEDGASGGPLLKLDRNSASPAVSDFTGGIEWYGRNGSAGSVQLGAIYSILRTSVTAGAESATLSMYSRAAGTMTNRMNVGAGVYHTNATGGDKGDNTINFGAVYDDNSLLTCQALQEEFLERGEIDLAKWDAMVPATIVPAWEEEIPVEEEVEVTRRVLVRDEDRVPVEVDGAFVSRIETVTMKRQVIEIIPVYDEDGVTGVDMIERPAVTKVIHEQQVIVRQHTTARLFQAMLDEGFDPRDPRNYLDRLERDHQLPGMPTLAGGTAAGQWEHNALSVGELASRKWLALEFLALAFRGFVRETDATIAALTARVAALEERRKA